MSNGRCVCFVYTIIIYYRNPVINANIVDPAASDLGLHYLFISLVMGRRA